MLKIRFNKGFVYVFFQGLFLSSFFFKDLFIFYVYSILSILPACMLGGQKRAPDLTTDGCEPAYGCWELNS